MGTKLRTLKIGKIATQFNPSLILLIWELKYILSLCKFENCMKLLFVDFRLGQKSRKIDQTNLTQVGLTKIIDFV